MSSDSRHRLGLLAVTAISLFGALLARLWFLQIVEGDSFTLQAEGNATQEVIIPAPRGAIYDRNGVALVQNRQSIIVGIDRQAYADLDDDEQADLKQRLSAALSFAKPVPDQVTVDDIDAKLNDTRYSKFRPVPIAEDLTVEDEIYFSEQQDRYPSVVVERTTVREYPFGSLAAHVLGYVGALSDTQWADLKDHNDAAKPYVQTDEIGKAGVEATYEEYLRGTPGKRVYEVDRAGDIVREVVAKRVDPKPGDDLYLSLDARVQYKAEEALQAQLLNAFQGREGAAAGSMVVMDHSTGQVRAMASYPTYDPSDLVGGISCPVWRDLQGLDREGPCGDDMTEEIKQRKEDGDPVTPKLLNRALQGSYPPASTFKLASSYAALKVGLITPQTSYADGGSYRLCDGDGPGCLKQNSGGTGHGTVNLQTALTVSSDVFFYWIGDNVWAQRETLGETAMQDAVADLGYGAKSGIDLPGESPGQVPTPDSELELALALYDADPAAYDNDIENAKQAGRWVGGFSADMAIGQKVNATPLQTANAYSALANGGSLLQPSVMEKVTAAGEPDQVVVAHERKVIRTLDFFGAEPSYIAGFRGVVDPTYGNGGTAQSAFSGFPFSSMPLGGKTGTAQTGEDPKTGYERPDNSLFVGFSVGGPTAWTASAMLEYSGFGAGAAAPAVRMVLEPIADGSIYQFRIPSGGDIDAESAAEQSAGLGGGGAD
ncbi:MAG: penicillin-binding transpeptidase domain-containing protein [Acidimicrobiales bacterium]|nr:hypothetical protein [Acidimicrobiales bacterium]